jgi:hypothetical protein
MDRCELCQALLLEYLYDLIEGDELRSLEAHLADCAKCRAALEKTKGHQRLLAAAAKTEFAGVRFQPPPNADPALATIPLTVRRERPRVLRWAMAAAVLLAVVALGGATAWVHHDYALAQGVIDEHHVAMVAVEREKIEITQKERAIPAREQARLGEVENKLRQLGLNVVVSGPRNIEPGANTPYLIHPEDLNGQPTTAVLSARVRDSKGNVLFEQKDIKAQGEYRLILPPTVPIPPHEKPVLEILARKESGAVGELKQQLDLVAPVYITHLATDKPMYQPGETVRYRSLTLERFSLKPVQEPLQIIYTLLDPGGAQMPLASGSPLVNKQDTRTGAVTQVLGPDKKPVRGIGAGEFGIPLNAAGGEYTLRVSEAFNRFPAQDRKFLVNQYQAHKLDKKLDFSKKSYGPGEDVSASCEAKRAGGGGEVANRPVLATVKVDGTQYGGDGKPSNQPIRFQTDAHGKVAIRFKLPAPIQTGDATVGVLFEDGANAETMVKPIPVILKKLDVRFYPEGGNLIAGAENRVYFQVRNTRGKPADLQGHIVDAEKKTVVDSVQTLTDAQQPGVNQGLGAFTFTPKAGGNYELKIDSPTGMEGVYPLPDVKETGVVLTIPKGVTTPKEPIEAVVRSAAVDRKLLIGAYCRGRLLDQQAVTVKNGEEAKVALNPTAGAGGVYRVTVFEENLQGQRGSSPELRPVAERLVYRQPAEELHITVKPDKQVYIPGDPVKLSISAVNEQEKPAPAILMVAVVDKSIVTMADEKTHRAMPTHFLMTSEVEKPEDLEYADFLIGSHPKAAAALDLLLGTQGWRRFLEQDPAQIKQRHADDAERMLVSIGRAEISRDLAERERQKVTEETKLELAQLQEQQKETLQRMQQERVNAAYLAALAKVTHYDEWLLMGRQYGLPALALVFVVFAICALVVALTRHSSRSIVYFVASAACAVLACVLVMNHLEKKSHQTQAFVAVKESTMDRGGVMKAAPRMAPMKQTDAPRPMAAEGAQARERLARPGDDKDKKADKLEEAPAPAAPLDAAALGDDRNAARGDGRPQGMVENGKGKKLDKGGQLLGVEKEVKRLEEFRRGGVNLQRADGERPWNFGAKQGNNGAFAGGMPGGGMRGGMGGFGAGRPPGPAAAGGAEAAPNQLRALGYIGPDRARGLDDKDMRKRADLRLEEAKQQAQMIQLPPFVVREYAHFHTHGEAANRRSDATETVYWNPVVVLPDGKAEVSFELSDQVTNFEVTAYGHTLDGRLGAVTSTLESRLPLTLEAKTPIEVTANDKIDIPLAIANNTATARSVQLNAVFKNLSLLQGKAQDQFNLAADGRTRRIYRLQPTSVEGMAELTFHGESKPFAGDDVRRVFKIVPDGFPVLAAKSDLLEGSATNEVVLPETWIKGTLKLGVSVYPSTLADLQKGLDGLLREPNGCFEQTSTTNYPNLLILDYLKESDQTKPELEKRARELLARGYQKLTAFECPKTGQKDRTGFDWFGGKDQQHEALSAYGLLQFRDMSRVMDVDPNLIARTRGYLLAQRDGKGGFKRNARAIDSFGRAPDDITNAYIVWSITESGKDDDVTTELEALGGQAKTSKDPYFLALVANSLINRAKTAEAMDLLKKLVAAQQSDGHLNAERTSITGSGGRDLEIETTGLAVLGWLKGNPGEFNAPVQKAIKWIGQQRGGYGGFGSTQSTILALKALIAYTKANKKTPEAGTLTLFVGDKPVSKLGFPTDAREALEIKLADAEKVLKPGKNTVRVEITGKNAFPYTLSWSYQTLQPASAEDAPVRLTTKLDRATANEGESVTLNVTVENPLDAERSMVVAIVGLPAGLTIPEDMKQLKEHAQPRDDGTKPGRISYFETRGRELILYWRGIGPKQKLEVPVELICRVPGEYRGPASRAYMYYNADHKHWVEPLAVTIQAKSE